MQKKSLNRATRCLALILAALLLVTGVSTVAWATEELWESSITLVATEELEIAETGEMQAVGGVPVTAASSLPSALQNGLMLDVDFTNRMVVDHAQERTFRGASTTAAHIRMDATLERYVGEIGGQNENAWITDWTWDNVTRRTLTMETLLRLDSPVPSGGWRSPFGAMQSGGIGFCFYPGPDANHAHFGVHIGLNTSGNWQRDTPNVAIPIGEWIHAVATFDTNAVRLYVNGEFAASVDTSGHDIWPPSAALAHGFAIGADIDGSGNAEAAFDGAIGLARIWNRPLTAAEISTLAEAAAPGTQTPAPRLSLSPSGNHTFPMATEGYGAQTAHSVTVNNTGTAATGALTITLSGANPGSFTLSRTSIANIAADDNESFTVVPNEGLAPGTYTAIVTVDGANVTAQTFNLSFMVRSAASTSSLPTHLGAGTILDVDFSDGAIVDHARGRQILGANVPNSANITWTDTTPIDRYVGNITNAASAWRATGFGNSDWADFGTSMTMETMFRLNARVTSSWQGAFGSSAGGGAVFSFYPLTGSTTHSRLVFWARLESDGTGGREISVNVTHENWYHAVATFDGQVFRLYLNGDFVGSMPGNNGVPLQQVSSANFGIGSCVAAGGAVRNQFNGAVGLARMWDRPLNAAEVRELAGEAGMLPQYSISLNPRGSHTFPAGLATEDGYYSVPLAHHVTVTNTGTAPLTELEITLSGENDDAFMLSQDTFSNIAADADIAFSVQPIGGLALGTYTATVTVKGHEVEAQSFGISFTVIRAGVVEPANMIDVLFGEVEDDRLAPIDRSPFNRQFTGNTYNRNIAFYEPLDLYVGEISRVGSNVWVTPFSSEAWNTIGQNVTMETIFRLEGPVSGWETPFSAMWLGRGIGLNLYPGTTDEYARMQAYVGFGGWQYADMGPVEIGRWYHAAMTYDGQVIRLYLNGVQTAYRVHAGTIAMPLDNVTQLAIGGDTGGAGSNPSIRGPLNGSVARARMWSRALVAEEIQILADEIDLPEPPRTLRRSYDREVHADGSVSVSITLENPPLEEGAEATGPVAATVALNVLGDANIVAGQREVQVTVPVGESETVSWTAAPVAGSARLIISFDAGDGRLVNERVGRVTTRGAGWVSGDIHNHSRHSDGSGTILQNFTVGYSAGIDFINTSDHHNSTAWSWVGNTQTGAGNSREAAWMAASGQDSPTRLIPIAGNEVGGTGHVVAMNVLEPASPTETGRNLNYNFYNRVAAGPGRIVRATREVKELTNGRALTFAAHPYDGTGHPNPFGERLYEGVDYWTAFGDDLDGIEVWNAWYAANFWANYYARQTWDRLNRERLDGRRLFGVATTDAHSAAGIGAAYTTALVDSYSIDGIVDAYKRGHMYGSNGPVITAFNIGDVMMGDEMEIAPSGQYVDIAIDLYYFEPIDRLLLIRNGRDPAITREHARFGDVYADGYTRIIPVNGTSHSSTQRIWVEPGDFVRLEVEGTELRSRSLTTGSYGSHSFFTQAPFAFTNPIFFIEDEEINLPVADMLDVDFAGGIIADHSPSNRSVGNHLVNADHIVWDDDYLRYAAEIGAHHPFAWNVNWHHNNDWAQINNSLTLETMFRLDHPVPAAASPSTPDQRGWQSPFGALQNNAGAGFRLLPNDADTAILDFSAHIAGSWRRVSTTVEIGEWNHASATFDGEVVRLYVNGQFAGEVEVTGSITHPSSAGSQQWWAIGANIFTGGIIRTEAAIDGAVGLARIYSTALSSAEIGVLADYAMGTENRALSLTRTYNRTENADGSVTVSVTFRNTNPTETGEASVRLGVLGVGQMTVNGSILSGGSTASQSVQVAAGASETVSWTVSAEGGSARLIVLSTVEDGPEAEQRIGRVTAPGNAGWISGDTHTHTLYSDGTGTLAENFAVAAQAGIDFYQISEHDGGGQVLQSWVSAQAAGAVHGVIPLNGVEHGSNLGHALFMGNVQDNNYLAAATASLTAEGLPTNNGRRTARAIELFRAHDPDGLVFAAHPYDGTTAEWSAGNMFGPNWDGLNAAGEPIAATGGAFLDVDGIEVWNGWYGPNYNLNRSRPTWDRLNRQGRMLSGIATTDAHSAIATGVVYTTVLVEDFDESGVIDQRDVREGFRSRRMFGSNGPVITDFSVEVDGQTYIMGDVVEIEPDGQSVTIRFAGHYMHDLAAVLFITNRTADDSRNIERIALDGARSFELSRTINVLPGDFFRIEIEGVEEGLRRLDFGSWWSAALRNQAPFAFSNPIFFIEEEAPVNAEQPNITADPQDATVNVGGEVNLAVTAGVTDSGTLSYQWYSAPGATSGTFAPVDGATSATFTPDTATVGVTRYRVVVTNTLASATGTQTATATSEIATVTVNTSGTGEPPVNRAPLETLITQKLERDGANYTHATWQAAVEALENAQAVLDDATATQAQVDAAYTALRNAKNALVPIVSGWNPFADVRQGQWYYDAVRFTFENHIVQGTSSTTFAPSATLTRAMMVQILYNMEGRPDVTVESVFYDVDAGKWYSDAIVWANQNGIIIGVGGNRFAPHNDITRQELATIMYRFAEFKGFDTTVRQGSLWNDFTDTNQISDWAENALIWANYHRIVNGVPGLRIVPLGDATRAEAVQIIKNFVNAFGE